MRHSITVIAVLLSVTGCAGLDDPYQRAGTWSPERLADANLREMVANPFDLQRGGGSPGVLGTSAVNAVNRLRTDTVKDLPDTKIGSIGGGTGTGGTGGGAN